MRTRKFKMTKRHSKRSSIPKTWAGILKKEEKYILKTEPGPHRKELSMPLEVVLKILGFAQTKREAKKILNTKNIIVDGRRIKSSKFPVGLFDVLTITETGENFRGTLDENGQLLFKPIKKENSKLKASKIIGKTVIRGGKIQINLSDARNIITEKTQNKVGDTLLIEVPEQKVVKHLPLEKGAKILLIAGKHSGDKGTVEKIEGERLVYKNKESIITLKEYAFVLPEEME